MRWMRKDGLLALGLVAALAVGCGRGGDDPEASGRAAAADSTASGDKTPQDSGDAARADRDSRKAAGGDKDKKAAQKKIEAVPVDIAILARGPIESVLRTTANLEAEAQVAVVAEAARRVVELRVEEGDRVRRGDLLLRLEDAEQRTALKRAEYNLDKARREFEKQKSLWERDLTSEQAFHDARDEYERQKLIAEDAKRELSYTQVRAPIDGTVTARYVNLGNQVQVGQHLFDIVDFGTLVAPVYVPEKNLKELREGLPARIVARAVREQPFHGAIKRIAPVVDPKSGTVKVTIDVGGQEGLRPGLFVDVALVTAVHDDALLIPKRALVYDNDQIFCYRLHGRHVERLPVMPLLANRDHVMPAGGFAAGDSVVVAGHAGLKDGALVRLPGDPEAEEGSEAASEDVAQEGATQ